MSSVIIAGDTSGSVTLQAPATAGSTVVNLPSTLGNTGTSSFATTDASGNLGIGVTPSAFFSANRALQIGSSRGVSIVQRNADESYFGQNFYFNSSDTSTYAATGYATRMGIFNGSVFWEQAASGTGGTTASFTQAMTLDASGNLLLGTTTQVGKLNVLTSVDNGNNTDYSQTNLAFGNAAYPVYIKARRYTGSYANGLDFYYTDAGTGASTLGARIDSSGNLLVGTTSGDEKLRLYGDFNAKWCIGLRSTAGAVAQNYLQFVVSSGGSPAQVGSITSNGTTTTYGTSSDYRLKENITPMIGALATVAQLKPCTYTWKSNGSAGQGFVAHELQAVVPDAVTGEKDAVDEEGNIKPQGIDTSFLVATLTAAIQELNAKFEEYKAAHP